ncbi:glycosyltransferase family 2 protein [Winogradskyella sp.]|uniref:glycosyltransferase family 2 protein n=1 Tax=Winogradskyella sp. TaxID=1883156 RepID=UPI003F6C3D9F
MPFFSVVIPLYNKAEYISACINSVLQQSFNDYDVIVVNDGSTDDSVGIVEAISSNKISIFNQENSGVSIARNNGVKFAKGEFIAFLDADDIWKNNHLEILNQSIQAFPDAGLYCSNYEINYNGNYTKPAQLNFEYANTPMLLKDFFLASLKDTVVWTSASAISRQKFLDIGMFNPIYITGQDLDLWIRIALKDTIIFHPEQTMIYNKSITDSLSKSEHNEARFALFSSFVFYENDNQNLKRYLDKKRYGLALRTKIHGELEIYRKTIKLINKNNLSFKQKTFLNLPGFILAPLNKIRPFIISNKLYLSLFKR